MLRSLLALLAVLVPGLAFLFERPWLYVVTGLILGGGLGLLGWWLWTTFSREDPDRPRPTPDPENAEPNLEEMGIVDIKPKDTAEEVDTGTSAETTPPAENAPNRDRGTPASSPAVSSTAAADASSSTQASDPSAPGYGETEAKKAPVLAPLLESLRAAIDARTICLLIQEDVALTYRIEAIASTHPSIQSSGTFDTQTPLLTATMSRESVTIRSLAEEKIAIEDLRYYDDPPPVDCLAAAPVSRPETSSTTFLLADAAADTDLGTSEARTLLDHFSDTVSLLLSTTQSTSSSSEAGASEEQVNGQHSGSDATTESSETSANNDSSPRPRHEIIAEEMESAQATDDELALALVHLNRAESIARQGDEAVASAERLFHARLDQLAPNQRIERFGELTYGIFFREGLDAVEPQVADLETTMSREDGELEGGVSVGVAMWGGRNDNPKALRAEATEALREAYETGTPTIVA
jgi:hypothetical protein